MGAERRKGHDWAYQPSFGKKTKRGLDDREGTTYHFLVLTEGKAVSEKNAGLSGLKKKKGRGARKEVNCGQRETWVGEGAKRISK